MGVFKLACLPRIVVSDTPPGIGFLFQLIGRPQQVPVNQSILMGWDASPLAARVVPSGEAVEHGSRAKCLLCASNLYPQDLWI